MKVNTFLAAAVVVLLAKNAAVPAQVKTNVPATVELAAPLGAIRQPAPVAPATAGTSDSLQATNPKTTSGRQNNPASSGSALAKRLADELRDAGVPISSNDLNDLTKAIAEGGQRGLAIAIFVANAIADVKAKQLSQGDGISQQTKVELSAGQVADMIKAITGGKDSTLQISQYLKVKLGQAKIHAQKAWH